MNSISSTSLSLPGEFVNCPNKVIEAADLSCTEKVLWIVIKGHCVGRNDDCFPSINRLASFIGLEYRQTQNLIRSLEEKGFLNRKQRSGKTTIFTPLCPLPPLQPITGVIDDPCNPLHITPATRCATPLQPIAYESDVLNQMKESNGTTSSDNKKSDRKKSTNQKQTTNPNVKLLMDYYCAEYEKTFQHKYTISGQRDGQIFKDLLKDHSVETLQRCIDLLLVDTDLWLNGKRTIPVLRSRINQYVQTAIATKPDGPIPAAFRELPRLEARKTNEHT